MPIQKAQQYSINKQFDVFLEVLMFGVVKSLFLGNFQNFVTKWKCEIVNPYAAGCSFYNT